MRDLRRETAAIPSRQWRRMVKASQSQKDAGRKKLEDLLRVVAHPRCGIIRQIAAVPLYPECPPVFVYRCELANRLIYKAGTVSPARPVNFALASGAGMTRERALWAMMGEAIERYSASVVLEERMVTAKESELAGPAVSPCDFIGYSEDQRDLPGFEYRRYDARNPIRWIEAFRPATGESMFVPASMAWLSYDCMNTNESFQQSLSTGLGAGSTVAQAAYAGLCEVVERDAFMCHWMLRRPPRQLSISAEDLHAVDSLGKLLSEDSYLSASTLDLSMDHNVPAIAVLIRPKARNVAVLGASAHTCLHRAIEKAFIEACQNWVWAESLIREGVNAPAADEVRRFRDHLRFYLDEKNYDKLSFLVIGPTVALDHSSRAVEYGTDDEWAKLVHGCGSLETLGYRVLVIDLTPSDVRHLGFNVVRVLVPGLQPLYMGTRFINGDTRRLERIARHWGYSTRVTPNYDPHPFP
jgi:ribosomal protein S12 methylthiotransferase accessory factor